MTKNKQKLTTKEEVKHLRQAVMGINNVLAMYVDYNDDMKGFQRFMKEKAEQKQEERVKSKEETK